MIIGLLPGLAAPDVLLTAMPLNSQLYARNRTLNRANVPVTGKVRNAGSTAAVLKVLRNGSTYNIVSNALVYTGSEASFSFAPQIIAELINYSFRLSIWQGTNEFVVATADSVVAGDAYLINGQSNAEAWIYSGSSSGNQHAFLRSFGAPAASGVADVTWHQAVGDTRYGAGMIGQWGMRFGRLLLNTYQIPIAILNAAEPSKDITYFQRNNSNPTDVSTNYGRLLYRTQLAGLTNGIRAILWYQGESDWRNSPAIHESGFIAVYQNWMADFPSVEKVYVHQVREMPVMAAWGDGLDLRNRQRLFQDTFSNIRVMSTTGIDAYGYSSWHYAYTGGYEVLGTRIFNQVARDLYGGSGSNVEAPNIRYACFNNAARDEIALVMRNSTDTLTWGAGAHVDFAVNGNTNAAVSGSVSNGAIILKLGAPVSAGATVSYCGHGANIGPWVYNANGVGLLAFYNVPVLAPPSLTPSKLAKPEVTSTHATLTFNTAQGGLYTLQYRTNLATGSWLPFYGPFWGSGSAVKVTNSPPATRFYRLRAAPY